MHWEMLLSLLKKRVSDRIRKRIRAIEQELLFIVQKKRKTVTRIFTGRVKDGSYYCLFVFLSIVLFIVWGGAQVAEAERASLCTFFGTNVNGTLNDTRHRQFLLSCRFLRVLGYNNSVVDILI